MDKIELPELSAFVEEMETTVPGLIRVERVLMQVRRDEPFAFLKPGTKVVVRAGEKESLFQVNFREMRADSPCLTVGFHRLTTAADYEDLTTTRSTSTSSSS